MLKEYQNVYWSRLIAVQGFQAVQDDENRYKWPLGPDIVEECNAVAELPAVDNEAWTPLYDPYDFN